MANEFGSSYRQLVQDTNEGKVAPSVDTTITTSQQSAGGGVTRVTNSDKPALAQAFLKMGTKVLGAMNERADARAEVEGYNKGLDEGYAESQRSPLKDLLFGPSPSLRGAQKRIVQNESRNWLSGMMASLKDDIKAMDGDEYQKHLSDQLQSAMETQTDPEIKAQLQESAASHFETLARNHTQARDLWIANVSDAAVEDTMNSAMLRMRNAAQFGDAKSQQEATDEAETMFDQPLDMSHERWLETTNRVMIAGLVRGDNLAYRMAEEKGIIDMMTPTEQVKLDTARQMYERKNGRDFSIDAIDLETRISKGTATDDDLLAHKAKYPEQSKDLNVLRKELSDAQEVIAEIRRKEAQAVDDYYNGDVAFADLNAVEKRKAVATVFSTIAKDGMTRERATQIQDGTFNGDPKAQFTPEEQQAYMLDNPMRFAQVWAQHPDVETPMIQNLATNIASDFRRENLTEQDVQMLSKRVGAMKVFQKEDPVAFGNQFRSDADASKFEVYSYLVDDAGYPPVNAVRELRLIESLPDIDTKTEKYQEDIRDNMSTLADYFLDNSPESQGVLGIYNKTPNNAQVFDQELRMRLEKSLHMFKGNMDMALPAAKAAMRRNGIVSNGQFIPNGKTMIDIKGGSVEDFIRGVNASADYRALITNTNNGFAVDTDYTSLEITPNAFNPKSVTIHGRHKDTGYPINVIVNTPQRGSEFRTYGINSFTGYNPNIANTDERKRVMLRNNKQARGIKMVGKFIDQLTE